MVLARQIALLIVLLSSLSAQHNRFGSPACAGLDQELADRSFFLLCHSASRKLPLWVGYELKPEHLNPVAARPTRFQPDVAVTHPTAQDSDYKYGGYSRGHLAPAADFAWSDESIRTTFLLSNAVPRRQNVNAGLWAQLERAVRRIAADSDAAYVFSGPLFEGHVEVIGASRVAVPSHFFKAVLVLRGGERTMYAAIIPNSPFIAEPLSAFLTTVNEIQDRTGLDFFSALDDAEQRRLESSQSPLPETRARLRSRMRH